MGEFQRDLGRAFCPSPLLKQGQLQPIAQDHLQVAFGYLQGWRLHHLSGQPMPVLSHPHFEEVFPGALMEPAVFQFVPVASGPVPGQPPKRAWLCPLPFSCLYTFMGSP